MMIPPINFQSAHPQPQTREELLRRIEEVIAERPNATELGQARPLNTISDSLMVLSGLTADGGGLSNVFITGFTPFGEPLDQSVPLIGNAWHFDLLPTEAGRYTLYVEATDEAGNEMAVGPFEVDITLPIVLC